MQIYGTLKNATAFPVSPLPSPSLYELDSFLESRAMAPYERGRG